MEIQNGDESAFPLNIADCHSKGTTFFMSEFLVCTSNVDPTENSTSFGSVMVDPIAFSRKLDICANVARIGSSNPVFDNNSIFFFTIRVGKCLTKLTFISDRVYAFKCIPSQNSVNANFMCTAINNVIRELSIERKNFSFFSAKRSLAKFKRCLNVTKIEEALQNLVCTMNNIN
ncbi:hypothetical protein A3Q56_06060 [Intoshia linei]|uniref:Uncharacterized protein n=1 Tax=Intoshia linei TaxID=1819745 RepID=A0A177AYG5_9BILA|nr:hypothetical protein A3Q56_06060 [Intoshia linei]